ncbi:glycosyltransferase [Polynucleobacter paneuropaeus]|nr:glycosyltransferase [Polynucleobacter paneuropaeus]
MRILHFYKNALPETIGGVEQVIDQIARGTGVLGVSNTVLALSNNPANFPTPMHGYELVTVKRDFELVSNGFSRQSLSVFKELATKADLIHYHFPWPFADLVHRWVSPKKPTVLTYHSDIIRQKLLLKLYRPLKQGFLRSVDHIVATSPNYLNTSGVLQSFSEKTSVIPIGLDQESYLKPDPSQIQYYQEHFGNRFFLFIGAFRYYKGLPFLIEAAKITPYPIVIVGSGPAEKELRALATKHQLKNVFFLGQVPEENKSALLAACYSIIFPSNLRSEAFGVSLLEGAMFGKPLISCEIGTGTTYINIDQLTGLVVPPSDPLALSNAMTWLWNHPDQVGEMGKKAYARYKELFTSKQMAQSYYELYQKLLNR